MATAVSDLCDAHFDRIQSGEVRCLSSCFRVYGAKTCCAGEVVTLQVFEDNSLVREALEERVSGKVLVIDGGGSQRCALLGGNLASLAVVNGWSGVIVDGCVRDVAEIRVAQADVRALGSCPVKSVKKGQGQKNVPVTVGGVRVCPGEWCYADLDGIIVSSQPLSWP